MRTQCAESIPFPRLLMLPAWLALAAVCGPPLPVTAAAAENGGSTPEIREVVRWRHGDERRRLLRVEDGICFVTGIGGNFEGGGEAVRVYVDDGWWWIGGHSAQPSLWVEVTCLAWRGHPPEPAAGPSAKGSTPQRWIAPALLTAASPPSQKRLCANEAGLSLHARVQSVARTLLRRGKRATSRSPS